MTRVLIGHTVIRTAWNKWYIDGQLRVGVSNALAALRK